MIRSSSTPSLSSRAKWLPTFAVCLAVSTIAMPGYAEPTDQQRAAARVVGAEGVALYQQGKFAEALDRFERAHALVDATTTGLWTARTLDKLGRLVEASERYIEVTRKTVPDGAVAVRHEAKEQAAAERAALQPRIPNVLLDVTVATEGVAFTAKLDGREHPAALLGVSQQIDPGDHLFEAMAGDAHQQRRFSISEGQTMEVRLSLDATAPDPAAAPPPIEAVDDPPASAAPSPVAADSGVDHGSTQRTLGWVGVAAGAAGIVVGAVGGGLAIGKKSTLDEGCPEDRCPAALHGEIDAYETLRTVSSVGFITGAVLAAAGATLLLTAPSSDSARVEVRPSLAGANVVMTF